VRRPDERIYYSTNVVKLTAPTNLGIPYHPLLITMAESYGFYLARISGALGCQIDFEFENMYLSDIISLILNKVRTIN